MYHRTSKLLCAVIGGIPRPEPFKAKGSAPGVDVAFGCGRVGGAEQKGDEAGFDGDFSEAEDGAFVVIC